MPELPEVETVRRGLAARVVGSTLGAVHVEHPRTIRLQPGGESQFAAGVQHHAVTAADRRGKYLWLTLDGGPDVVVAHLGMSGQFRVVDLSAIAEPDPHRRTWWELDVDLALVFRDQRTFGWLLSDTLNEESVPRAASHVGMDPFDPEFDAATVAKRLALSRSGIKRALLAQRVVSGVGNIYADEALWRARVHPETPAAELGPEGCLTVLCAAVAVMSAALAAGGTSFDPLYVSVNGESGWFDRSLDVYGRDGFACPRCGTAIVRERFTNRYSHRCPACQPAGTRRPRRRVIDAALSTQRHN